MRHLADYHVLLSYPPVYGIEVKDVPVLGQPAAPCGAIDQRDKKPIFSVDLMMRVSLHHATAAASGGGWVCLGL